MARGDHLITSLELYTHHGVDVGDGTVVHWVRPLGQGDDLPGLTAAKRDAQIRRTALAAFSQGRPVWIGRYLRCFDAETVVARALSRLGERGYHVSQNNCEHFATWCKIGRHHSAQVCAATAAVAGAAGIITGSAGGMGVVSAAGPLAGLGPGGVIAGLGAVGRMLGGGPAAGLVGVVSMPAAASVLTVRALLPDDRSRTEPEQQARTAGRVAATGGAAAGTAAAVGVVAGAGVPGLGSIGIASGLAALGGGSAAVGLAAAIAFPVAVTLGAAWLAYQLARHGTNER